MELHRAGSQPSMKGPAEYFTGTVRIDPLNNPPAPARVTCASVTFEPGARSNWHTHPLGQTLIVTAGCGWTQCDGEPIVEIRAGTRDDLGQRRRTHEQLVQHDAERVDIAARVHGDTAGLLGRHVLQRSDHVALFGSVRLLGELLVVDGFGDAEIDDFRNGRAVVKRDEHVWGLDVAVNNALDVRVMSRFTDGREERQGPKA